MAITRISVTIPRDLAKAIDARAKELDRSRSWVIAEAARRFLEADIEAVNQRRVAEPKAAYLVTPGLGPERQRQLEADLKLTPTQRVRAAENTRLFGQEVLKGKRRPSQVLSFEHYEDYLDWKRREGLLP